MYDCKRLCFKKCLKNENKINNIVKKKKILRLSLAQNLDISINIAGVIDMLPPLYTILV